MSATPGWYPDPSTGEMKYWDGANWSQATAPAPPQANPGMPPPPPSPAYGGGYAPAPYAAPGYGYGYGPALPPALQGQQMADYGTRAGAYLLDVLFIVFTIGIGAVVNWFLMAREGEKNGMTLGKQAVGIRVVKEDGQPVDIGFALLRELVVRGLLFGVVGWFFLGIPGLLDLLWPLWDDKDQTLHDKIVSSYVTKAPA